MPSKALGRVLTLLVAVHAVFGLYLVVKRASAVISDMVDEELEEEERQLVAATTPPPPPVAPAWDPEWGLKRIREGQPLRIAAAGLSRSGSTWQFNALRLILQHAVHTYGPRGAEPPHSQHGHTVDEVQNCLNRRYCVVKVHEFLPDVLAVRRTNLRLCLHLCPHQHCNYQLAPPRHLQCHLHTHLLRHRPSQRVHSVFLTHRDPRDVLLSSAQKISSCLAYGTQVLTTSPRPPVISP